MQLYPTLRTSHMNKLAGFLTQVFDIEISVSQQHGYYITIDGQRVYLRESDQALREQSFILVVSDTQKLEEIKMKIEFYQFREAIEGKINCSKEILEYFDFEGRVWQIEVQKDDADYVSQVSL